MTRESGIGDREFDTAEDEPGFQFFEDGPRGGIMDYRDLDVWKTAMSLTTEIYKLTGGFPPDERFGLTSQMRRAAVSIPANIAEGYGRETSGAYIQFLRISQGSARELETLIEISDQLDYLNAADCVGVNDALKRIIMMLGRLIRAIERRNGK